MKLQFVVVGHWNDLETLQWAAIGTLKWHRATILNSNRTSKTMYSNPGNWQRNSWNNKKSPQWMAMSPLVWCKSTLFSSNGTPEMKLRDPISSSETPEMMQSYFNKWYWGTWNDSEPPKWLARRHLRWHWPNPVSSNMTSGAKLTCFS